MFLDRCSRFSDCKGGPFDGPLRVPSWAPRVFGSRRAVQLDAEFGCYTDAALSLNGVDQYAQKTSPTFAPTTKMTIAFDYKPTTTAAAQTVVARMASGTQNQFSVLVLSGGALRIRISADLTDTGNYADTTETLSNGTNARVVVVYDGTLSAGSRLAVYINGVATTLSITGTIPATLTTSTDDLTVGTSGGGNFANGALARLGFSSQALSGSALADAHVSKMWSEMTAAEQARWFSHFDLCQRTGTLNDSTGLNDLTRVNSPGVAQGPTGRARALNGTTQRFARASEPALQAGDIPFYFASWVYIAATGAYQMIVSKGGVSDYEFRISPAGVPQLEVTGAGTASGAGALSTGAWHFVEAYHDPDADVIGVAADGAPWTMTPTGGPATTSPTTVVHIGTRDEGGVFGPFGGAICRTIFTKRLVTDAERRDLYRGGEGRLYANLPASLKDSALVFALDGTETDSGTLVDQHAGLDFTAVNSPTSTAGPGISGPCVDRSPCKRIEDQSDFKRHFYNPTMDEQPDWIADAVNGRPALSTGGPISRRLFSDLVTLAQPLTWFGVLRFTGSAATAGALIYGENSYTPAVYRRGDDKFGAYAGTEQEGGDSDTAWHTHAVIFNGAGSQYRLDGAADSISGNPGAASFSAEHMTLFNNYEMSFPGVGYIAAVLLLEGEPTEAEIVSATRFYRTRYGTP